MTFLCPRRLRRATVRGTRLRRFLLMLGLGVDRRGDGVLRIHFVLYFVY